MSPAIRALCGLICTSVLLVAPALAAPVWRDNFDAGTQLPWVSLRGNWAVTGGTYAAQQPGNAPVTAALLPYELTDFSVDVDVLEPADGGLWLRANADASAGVLLVVFPDRMYWHVVADPVGGPWTVYGYAAIQPSLGSGATRLRVTGNGPILRAYLNGAALPTSTLDLGTVSNPPGMDFLHGRVGLYDNAAPGTRFDNLRLEAGTPLPVVAVGDVGNASVRLFPIDAEGDVAPVAVLAGAGTGLADVRSLAFDSENLYVASGSGESIRAYAMGPLGDVAPVRTLAGPNTTLGGVYGIELDRGELFASSSTGPVCVFDALAAGDAAPLRCINAMSGAYAIAQDGNELFIARHFVDPTSVYAYARDATAADAPLRHLAGANTGLGCCNLGLAVTPAELLVSQYYDARILSFARNADGDSAPLRVLAGPATGLAMPLDISVRGSELFVANSATGDVRVYPADAGGDVAPMRVIGGPATGLSTPFSLAFGIYVVPDTLFANGFE